MLFEGRELEINKWDGDAEELLRGVREKLNALGEVSLSYYIIFFSQVGRIGCVGSLPNDSMRSYIYISALVKGREKQVPKRNDQSISVPGPDSTADHTLN